MTNFWYVALNKPKKEKKERKENKKLKRKNNTHDEDQL